MLSASQRVCRTYTVSPGYRRPALSDSVLLSLRMTSSFSAVPDVERAIFVAAGSVPVASGAGDGAECWRMALVGRRLIVDLIGIR